MPRSVPFRALGSAAKTLRGGGRIIRKESSAETRPQDTGYSVDAIELFQQPNKHRFTDSQQIIVVINVYNFFAFFSIKTRF